MKTALSSASEHLKISDTNQRLLKALLTATSDALAGNLISIPVRDISKVLDLAEDDAAGVFAALEDLFTPFYKVPYGYGTMQFSFLVKFALSEDGSMVKYAINEGLTQYLTDLAKKEGLEQLV